MNYKTWFIGKYKIKGVDNYTTLDKAVKYLSDKKIIGIDIETSRKYPKEKYNEQVYKGGLDPYLSNVIMLQIGDLKNIFVIDVRDYTKEELKPVIDFLNYRDDKLFVGHNLRFEAKHLKHKYGLNFKLIHDTMITEMTLTNGIPAKYGLANLAEKYLDVKQKKDNLLFEENYDDKLITLDDELLEEFDHALTPFDVADDYEIDKSTRLEFINIGDRPFTEKQVLYGGDDVIMPILIRQRQLLGRKVKDDEVYNPKSWQRLENKYCLFLADMELNGMHVREDMWKDLHNQNQEVYNERLKKLNEYVIKTYPEYVSNNYDLFSGDLSCNIKWTGSKDVISFFKKLDICPRAYSKQTGKVEDTVGATELLKTLPNKLKGAYMKNKDVEITDLDTLKLGFLLFKKAEQAITTFGKKWLKYVHPITGRAHSNYRQILNTVRISSTNPNMQNISGGAWRNCFEVPEGKIMVNADYSAQEVRVLANICQDPDLISFFVNGDEFFGDDFHSYTATKVFKILENNPDLVVPPKEIKVNGEVEDNPEFTKDDGEKRQNSKMATFGLAFGKSDYGFSQDFGISVEEAKKFVNSYLEAFSGLGDHFDKCEEKAETQDYVLINEKLDVRWYCEYFDDIDATYQQAFTEFKDAELLEEFQVGDYRQLQHNEREDYKTLLYEKKPFLKGLWSKAGRLKGSLVRKNKNYPVQGSAALCMKIAMVNLREKNIETGEKFKAVGNIHDEALLECDKEHGDFAGKILKECMEDAGKFITPSVPQVANYVLEKYWTH